MAGSAESPAVESASNHKGRGPKGKGRAFWPDILRGYSLWWMLMAHFIYDLRLARILEFDLQHWAWEAKHICILTMFTGVAGVSFHLATRNGVRWGRYIRGLVLLGLAAGAISAISGWFAPRNMIVFGVIHFFLAARILMLGLRYLPTLPLVILGIALIFVGSFVRLEALASFSWSWLGGAAEYRPRPLDEAPLAPWLGTYLLGYTFGRWYYGLRPLPTTHPRSGFVIGFLKFIGRHSLLIYLIHQPIFIGALMIAFRLPGWLGW